MGRRSLGVGRSPLGATPALLLVLLLVISPRARADGSNDRFFPNGGQRGTTVSLSFPGMASVESATLVVDGLGVKPVGPFLKGAGKLEIAADAEPGLRQVRLVGPKSATAPRPFLVGTLPVLLEAAEPNDSLEKAQKIDQLPVVVNGALNKGSDVDAYRVSLKKGDCLIAASESRRTAAPTNLALHVRDLSGREIPTEWDFHRRDPWYACAIPSDGEYVVQLNEVTNNMGGGGDDTLYWVTLTTGPWLDYVIPPGARRGAAAHLTFTGWNFGKAGPGTLTGDVNVPSDAGPEFAASAGGAPNSLPLATGDRPEISETEPNDTAAQAQAIEVPVTVNSVFAARGDRDCYRFQAQKGKTLDLRVDARELDSYADPVLLLQDTAGKTLETADDQQASRDPRMVWTPPADGTYTVVLRDVAVASRGGPTFYYRITIAPVEPELRLSVTEPMLLLKPGGKVELTVTVHQTFQTGEVTLQVEGLPPGVTAEPVKVKPQPDRKSSSQAKLVLNAAAGAVPAFGLIRVTGTAAGSAPLRTEARWMITGDGGWGFGTGSTTTLVAIITPPA